MSESKIPPSTAAAAAPSLTLHALAPSHPCMTVAGALRVKGLDFERVDLTPGRHNEEMERLYGEGNRTVPGLLVDGEPVHESRAILERLEVLRPEPGLYPRANAEAVREAERWGDEELQDLAVPTAIVLVPVGDQDARFGRAGDRFDVEQLVADGGR